jgi:hypothetical protein
MSANGWQTEAGLGLMKAGKKCREEASRMYSLMPQFGIYSYISSDGDDGMLSPMVRGACNRLCWHAVMQWKVFTMQGLFGFAVLVVDGDVAGS